MTRQNPIFRNSFGILQLSLFRIGVLFREKRGSSVCLGLRGENKVDTGQDPVQILDFVTIFLWHDVSKEDRPAF